jgi:hypothetical protein
MDVYRHAQVMMNAAQAAHDLVNHLSSEPRVYQSERSCRYRTKPNGQNFTRFLKNILKFVCK